MDINEVQDKNKFVKKTTLMGGAAGAFYGAVAVTLMSAPETSEVAAYVDLPTVIDGVVNVANPVINAFNEAYTVAADTLSQGAEQVGTFAKKLTKTLIIPVSTLAGGLGGRIGGKMAYLSNDND
jgi:hypothetical protein